MRFAESWVSVSWGYAPFGLAGAMLGGYLVALGVAVGVERQGPAGDPIRKLLSRPGRGAAIVGSLVLTAGLALGGAARRSQERATASQEKVFAESARQGRAAHSAFDACAASDRLAAYCGSARAIAVSPDGKRLVSVGDSGQGRTISLWDREAGRRLWQQALGGQGDDPYQAMVFSPDGATIAYTDREEGKLLAAGTGELVRPIAPCGEYGVVYPANGWQPMLHVAFSPDEPRMAVGGRGICLTETATGHVVRRFAAGTSECEFGAEALAFGANGVRLYSICNYVRVWDVRAGKQVGELAHARNDPEHVEPDRGSPTAMSVSPDETRILVDHVGGVGGLWLWDPKTKVGTHVGPLHCTDPFAFVGNDRALVGGQGLRLLDAATGQEKKHWLEGRSVVGFAVAPNGDVVVGAHASFPSTEASIVTIPARDLE
jgi:WD40 repeat protein